MTTTDHVTTRRAMFGVAAPAVAVIAAPAGCAALQSDPDQRFVEWASEARFWSTASNDSQPKTDEQLDALMDRAGHFEELIATTPAAGLTGARVKAAWLLSHREDFVSEDVYWADRCEMSAIRGLIDFLARGAA